MKLKLKLKKKGNKLEKLGKNLKKLNNESVEVGHFASQGKHSTTDLTYVELMAIANLGLNGPPRRVLTLLKHKERKLDDSQYNTLMQAWGKSNYGNAANKRLLEGFGSAMAMKEKALFGRVAPATMPANSPTTKKKVGVMGKNAPLVDTGELKSKVAYKTSLGKTVKES